MKFRCAMGFCCSRIGLGGSNTRPLSRPKARATHAGFFFVRPTYTTLALARLV